MQSKLEKLFGKDYARFIAIDDEIVQLQNLEEYCPHKIIALCLTNIELIKTYKDKKFYDICASDDFQIELLNKLGSCYLSIFKALSAIKIPEKNDESDRIMYRALAHEYYPAEVEQIDSERIKRIQLQLDEDYSLAVYLEDIEGNSQTYSNQRFFKLESKDDDSNVSLKQDNQSGLSI